MFIRGLIVIVLATAVAVGLLSLRQQRLSMMHDMAKLRDQMDAARQTTWDMQVRIAGRLDPPKLTKAIERAKLHLEPATPGAAQATAQLTAIKPVHTTDD